MPDHQLIGKDEIGPMHKHHKHCAIVLYGELHENFDSSHLHISFYIISVL